MKFRRETTILTTLSFIFLLTMISCGPKKEPTGKPPKSAAGSYIVMEKVLADKPGRNGTTMKIIIPKPEGATRRVLNAALAEARKNDPSLKSAIIWAYRTRDELNGSNFTVGKIEWSADGKDSAMKNDLTPNPKAEILIP